MKDYKIPIIYQRCETFDVAAESLEEAIKIAIADFFYIPDDLYIEDSFDIDHEGLEEEYKEKYNYNKILNEL